MPTEDDYLDTKHRDSVLSSQIDRCCTIINDLCRGVILIDANVEACPGLDLEAFTKEAITAYEEYLRVLRQKKEQLWDNEGN